MIKKKEINKSQSNQYQLLRRTILNSTYHNVIDENILEITLWKLHSTKYIIYILLHIVSVGLFFFIEAKWNEVFTWLACVESDPEQAQYARIKDSSNVSLIVPVKKENYNDIHNELAKETFDKLNREQIEQSPYLGFNAKDTNEHITFCYHFNKYEYNKDTQSFIGVSFDLSTMKHSQIHEAFNRVDNIGIPSIGVYNYMYNKYGLNYIQFHSNSFWGFLLKRFLSPITFYNIGAITLWFINNYSIVAVIMLVLLVFILCASSYKSYSNFAKLNKGRTNDDQTIQRNFTFKENKEWNTTKLHIVPGDIIILKEGDSIPCDGIILNGYCTLDESYITGESHSVVKTELPCDETMFSYANSSKSFIYQGSIIRQCYMCTKDKNCIIVLAVNTGNNTYKGNLLQNFDLFNDTYSSFFYDIRYFIIFIFAAWIGISIIFLIIQLDVELINYFDSLLVMFPPTLSVSLNFSFLLYDFSLSEYDLSCFMDKKLNAAGKINTILLDKTGTLTKEESSVHGLYSTEVRNGKVFVNYSQLPSSSNLNKILKQFYVEVKKRNCDDYHYDLKNNLIYFIECIASCHGLYLIRDNKEGYKTLGDCIDKQLYQFMGWQIISLKDNMSFKDKKVSMCVIPPNSCYINQDINQGKEDKSKLLYKLEYLNQFEFCSNYQAMSVIVKNTFNNTIRLYIKGAPERIKSLCKSETIPENYDSFYHYKAEQGYRILACATRVLSEEESMLKREDIETNMTFIGFIILVNSLKKNTKDTITKLKRSNCKMAIVSGDNVYTTMSVARECGIITRAHLVYLFDYNKEKNQLMIYPLMSHNEDSNDNISFSKCVRGNKRKKSTIKNYEVINFKKNYDMSNRSLTNDKQESTSKINDLLLSNTTNLSQLLVRIQIIHNSPNSLLCINGPAWIAIQEYLNQPSAIPPTSINSILEVIRQKGIIFSRMISTQKVKLVKFLQQDKDTTVCMCGDGVNDSIALMTSDVGISISKWVNSNTLISHFYSPNNSIQVIESLIRSGRAAYETNSMIFKFLFLSGIIQLTNLFIFTFFNLGYQPIQYLYIDLFCCLIPAILSSQSAPLEEFNHQFVPSSLINSKFLTGLIGQSILQCLFQVAYTIYVTNFALMVKKANDEVYWPDLADLFFMFSTFQYINTLFVVNLFSDNKKPFYRNYWFLLYQFFILFYNCGICIVKEFDNSFFGFSLIHINTNYKPSLEKRVQLNRILTIVFVSFQLFFSIGYEYGLYKWFQRKEHQSKEQQQLQQQQAASTPVA